MKKDLEYYLSLHYPMLLTWDEDEKVWFVQFPDLPGCMAHGKTPAKAIAIAHEIKMDWLKDALKDFMPPEPSTFAITSCSGGEIGAGK